MSRARSGGRVTTVRLTDWARHHQKPVWRLCGNATWAWAIRLMPFQQWASVLMDAVHGEARCKGAGYRKLGCVGVPQGPVGHAAHHVSVNLMPPATDTPSPRCTVGLVGLQTSCVSMHACPPPNAFSPPLLRSPYKKTTLASVAGGQRGQLGTCITHHLTTMHTLPYHHARVCGRWACGHTYPSPPCTPCSTTSPQARCLYPTNPTLHRWALVLRGPPNTDDSPPASPAH